MLRARIYEVFPLACLHCGAPMRILAFVTDTASVTRILQQLGDRPSRRRSPARGVRRQWEAPDHSPVSDPSAAQPAPAFEFDQTLSWSTSRATPRRARALGKRHGDVRAARRETPQPQPQATPSAGCACLGHPNPALSSDTPSPRLDRCAPRPYTPLCLEPLDFLGAASRAASLGGCKSLCRQLLDSDG
jgi:hypothetical protein